MKRLLIIFIVNLCVYAGLHSQEVFYYYKGEKRILTPAEDRVLIKTTETNGKEIDILLRNHSKITSENIKQGSDELISIRSTKADIAKLKNRLVDKSGIKYYSYYKTKTEEETAVTDEVIVKIKPGVPNTKILEAYKKVGAVEISSNKLFTVLQAVNSQDAFIMAGSLYETGLFEYAEPNFIMEVEFQSHIPNDEFFGNQFACHNTGQEINTIEHHRGTEDADIDAPEAWDITKGNGDIIIAVLDDGLISDHPDLPNTRQVRLGNPTPDSGDYHGTACAGVIAATMDNKQGIAGIAPLCKIMPLKLSKWGNASQFATLMIKAVDNGAKIISNSWTCRIDNDAQSIEDAFEYAYDNNVIVFQAIGNNADRENGYPDEPRFPSYLPGVIAVGATDRDDKQAYYSPSSINGHYVDICAPSHKAYPCQIDGEQLEMWTIDNPGTDGENPNSDNNPDYSPPFGEYLPSSGTNYDAYTGRFGGTSYACPLVAGVAALALSIDPDLTPSQMATLLHRTADRVGGYNYNTSGWCPELGSGRVNAFKMVMGACPTNYTIDWNLTTTEHLNYTASDFIKMESELVDDAYINVTAGNKIRLLPGFRGKKGSYLRAYIGGCTKLSDGGTLINTYQTEADVSQYSNTSFTTKTIQSLTENDILHKTQVRIFPNPGNGEFNISGLYGSNNLIKVYNILGEQVYSGYSTGYSTSISINNGTGIYMLKIYNPEGIEIIMERIIVK